MVIKRFISVFISAMFTVLVVSGLIAIILINIKQVQSDQRPKDSTNITDNSQSDSSDFLDRYVDSKIKPFNVLVFVNDIRGFDSDAIVLFNFDTENSKITAMSIPRDTMLRNGQKAISVYSSYTNSILKDEKVIEIFEDFLGIDIKYTVKMDLNSIEKIIDEMGGLYFNIPADMTYYDNGYDPLTGEIDPDLKLVIEFEKGEKHLTGQETVKLLRFKQASSGFETSQLNQYYPGGSDLDRIEMSKRIMNAFLNQVFEMSRKNLSTKLSSLLSLLYSEIDIHINLRDAQSILKLIIDSIPQDANQGNVWNEVIWHTLPGSYASYNSQWYYEIDVANSNTILNQYFSTSID